MFRVHDSVGPLGLWYSAELLADYMHQAELFESTFFIYFIFWKIARSTQTPSKNVSRVFAFIIRSEILRISKSAEKGLFQRICWRFLSLDMYTSQNLWYQVCHNIKNSRTKQWDDIKHDFTQKQTRWFIIVSMPSNQ